MAKPNFQYEKRQRDLAKKKKSEEKRLRKLEKKNLKSGANPELPMGTPAEAMEKPPE